MMLKIEFSSQAKKFVKKAETQVARRIIERIEQLLKEPFPTDVKRVEGEQGKFFRVRVGNYRVQYTVLYDINTLFIARIDKRERVY